MVTSSPYAWRKLSATQSGKRDGGGSTEAGERERGLLFAAFSSWYYQMVRLLPVDITLHVYSLPRGTVFTYEPSFGGVAKLVDLLAKANVSGDDRITSKWNITCPK